MKIKGFLLLSMMLLAGECVHADIYKWTDSSGGVHYSDTPRPGAERIEIPGIQLDSPPQPSSTITTQSASTGPLQFVYDKVAITQPTNDATIRNNQGYLSVSVATEPDLQESDLIQLVYDGSPVGTPQKNPNFILNNIDRGTHTLVAQILDKDGKKIIASDSVTFFMQRARVNMAPPPRTSG